MDGMGIDWNAGQVNPVTMGQQAQANALELGQRQATLNALQGIDLNNPDSISQGLGKLVKANALEQAGAVNNLAFQRQMRANIPTYMQTIADAMRGQSSDPGAQPAASGAQPGADQQALGFMTQAKTAVDNLASLPQDQRPAAFQKVKADFLQRGVPEQAIDAAGQDLSDAGLKNLSAHYGDVIAHGQASLAGQTPPEVAPHPSNNWYDNLSNSGPANLAIAQMKAAGWDLTPLIDNARALSLPGVTEAAHGQYAGPIAQATAQATKGVDAQFAPYFALMDAFKAGKVSAAQLPAEIAKINASAEAAARYEPATEPEQGPNGDTGRTVQTTKLQRARDVAGQTPVTQRSPEQAQSAAEQHATFQKEYASAGGAQGVQAEVGARDKALATAKMAQDPSINPNNLTGFVAQHANTLSAFIPGITADKANKLATWQNMIADNLRTAITVFPRNQSEMNVIEDAAAHAKMPGDAAALSLTLNAAVHDQMARYKQARLDYAQQAGNDATENGFQSFYQDPKHGYYTGASIFSSPVFRDLKYGGKPVVAISPKDYGGHKYGVFMPGTPQKTAFVVQ
jgi:hypothetical protein